MALDPKWTDNITGPFKDNTVGLIDASDLRDFAGDISTQVLIPGPTGPTGPTGPAGTNGADGATGPAGPTGPSGSVTYGTTAGTAAEGNDVRLSDQRTPTNASVTQAKISGTLTPATITGTAVITTDARLSDQRTPLDGSVTGPKMTNNSVTNARLANMPPSTIKANNAFSTGPPVDVDLVAFTNMIAGVLMASQVAVDTAGGLAGPTSQTAMQDLYGRVVAAADPVLR